MKSGKQHTTEGVELPNHVVIRTLGEKETYKYLGILETDSRRWKKKIKENIWENYSRQNYIAGTLSKDKYRDFPTRKILGTILEVNQRRT